MANKKVVSVLSTAAIGTLIATAVGSTVFAAVDGLVVKNAAGSYLNYDLDALKASVVNDALGQAGAELYKDFDAARTAGSIVSYHDNKVGFVDSAAVQKAALDAALAGTNFALDTFTESSKETVLPATVYQATVTNGKVVAGAEVKPTTSVTTAVAIDTVNVLNGGSIENNTSVPTNAKIVVNFTKALDSTTVNGSTFKLYQGTTLVAMNVPSLSTDKKVVTLTPSALLTDSKDYKLVISSDIKDVDGSKLAQSKEVAFKTSSATVASNVAANNVAVPVDGSVALDEAVASNVVNRINVTFNKGLDFTTVNTTNVKLYNVTDNTEVTVGAVTYNANVVTFDVSALYNAGNLKQNKQYRIETKNLRGVDGLAAADFSQTFYVTTAFATTPKLADGNVVAAAVGVNGKLTNDYNALTGALNKPAFRVVSTFATPLNEATLIKDNVKIVEKATQKVIDAAITYDAASKNLIVVPTADLADNTNYELVLTNGIKDIYGQKFATTQKYSFTTGDYTAPTVASSTPESGTAEIALDSKVVINFSEAMDPATFINNGATNTNTDKVIDANTAIVFVDNTTDTAVASTFAWTNSNKTLTITPAANLTASHTYTVKLGAANVYSYAAVKDANAKALAAEYNVVFNTGAGDLVAPKVAAVTKTSLTGTAVTTGAKSISTSQVLVAKFDKKITLADLNTTNVVLEDLTTGDAVNLADAGVIVSANSADAKYSYLTLDFGAIVDQDGAASVATVADLTQDHKYRLTISSEVRDASVNLNKLGSDYVFEFTTGLAPTVTVGSFIDDGIGAGTAGDNKINGTELTVANVANQTNIDADSKLAFTFSEEVRNVDANSIVVTDAQGNVVSGTIVAVDVNNNADATNNDEYVFIPSQALKGSTVYTISIKNAITDTVENPFVASTISFKTEDTVKPTILAVTPATSTFDIAVNSAITIKFDKDMDSATLNATNIPVKVGANAIAASYSYDAATKTLTITPKNYFATGTAYAVTVDVTAVKDISGNAINTSVAYNPTYTFVTGQNAIEAGITEATLNTTTNQLVIKLDKAVTNAALTAADLAIGNGGSLGTNKIVNLSADKKTIVVTFLKDNSATPVYDYIITPGVTTVDLQNTVTFADPVNGANNVAATSNAVTVK